MKNPKNVCQAKIFVCHPGENLAYYFPDDDDDITKTSKKSSKKSSKNHQKSSKNHQNIIKKNLRQISKFDQLNKQHPVDNFFF